MATIKQRIALEGGDDIAKKLKELGDAGEKSFKQISDAAAKAKVDPAQFTQTKQAIDGLVTTGSQLANQFLQLAQAATTFGNQGTRATAAVTAGLDQTNAAARQTGATMQQVGQQVATAGQTSGSELISTANKWRLAAVGIVAAVGAIVTALTKGAVETGAKIAEQAEKLKLSTAQWVALRNAIAAAGGSADDFIKGAGKTVDLIEKMKGEIAKVSTTFKVMGEDGKLVDVTVTALSKLTAESAATVTAFRALGVQMKTLQSGDTLAILTETAAIINRMPDGLKKTAAGVQFFGDSWKEVIKTLLAAKTATVDPIEAMRRKSRELTADQVDTAKKVKEAWADLGAAIRATRDMIGAFFAPGELARVEWLRDLVDQSRLLLKEWLALDAAGRIAFLRGVGEGAAATAFKILAAVSEQLAGIWRDVLVPAGEKLMGMVRSIAGSFEGVTTEQVIAGFITLGIALTGIAVAFKGIGFVLSPIIAVVGLIASFGPILIPLIALVVLFWDQIKAGASAVAGMLPLTIEKLKAAFGALLQGDFAGAWEQFSAAAVEAFETIKLIVIQTFNDIRTNGEGVFADLIRLISGGEIKTPWLATIVDGLKQIAAEGPGTLQLLIDGVIALGQAAERTANVLNGLFGTKLTGTDVAGLAIVLQYTGALQALASVAVIASAAIGTLVAVMGAGPAFLLVFFTSLAAALVLLGEKAVGLRDIIITAFANLPLVGLVASFIVAWDQIKAAAQAAWDAIVAGASAAKQAIIDFVTTPVAGAWGWLVTEWDKALASIAASWARLKGLLGFGGGGLAADAGIGDIGKFAGGGLLAGRGTGTSDSNLAWVSRGEHIMPARAVQQPGVLAFLEALRRTGGDLRAVLDGMGRFALGGMVAPTLSLPAFAGGGGGVPRNLGRLELGLPGGGTVIAYTDDRAVEAMRRAAALGQIRSGGRKPSRYS